MKSKSKVKARKSFTPDDIVTSISRALDRDLFRSKQVYGALESSIKSAVDRQGHDFLKKYVSPEVDQTSLEDQTYIKFLDVNDHMANFRNLDVPKSDYIQSWMPMEHKVLLRARALMRNVLVDFDEEEFFRECKHSGGASIGVSFVDTSLEAKFQFPLSTTDRAKPLFNQYINFDPRLWDAVKGYNIAYSLTKSADGNYCADDVISSNDMIYETVEGSRATTVDKTATSRRMIAIEPTVNMYLQQGLMSMMYARMRRVGLDVVSLPETHKRLARESSITGRNATIDFSSASDCVSIGLLKWLLPNKWYWVLNRVRSEYMHIKGMRVKLNMFSTMGNAGTFPLETLVFWTIAHACKLSLENEGNTSLIPHEVYSACSVFGDDCIVPSNVAELFCSMTEKFGFIVNSEKSFMGPERFRESCGGDYLAGFDVRPFHLRAPTSTSLSALEPWLYIIGNAMIPRYISYFGSRDYVYNRCFLRVYFSLFKRYGIRIKVVPNDMPDDAGLKISDDLLRLALCYDLQCEPMYMDKHGSITFHFCSFRYRKARRVDDGIRYFTLLKKPVYKLNPRPMFSKVRRYGGYVVAKRTTGHWSVPAIRPCAHAFQRPGFAQYRWLPVWEPQRSVR